MSKKLVRVGASVVVIVGALSFLMYTTMADQVEYYKHVDEVMASPDEWYGKRLQVHGFVQGDPIVNPQTLEYRFQMVSNGQVVSATYRGVVPDTFKRDAEVVVKGKLTPAGIEAHEIMAKCPSRYEADAAPKKITG